MRSPLASWAVLVLSVLSHRAAAADASVLEANSAFGLRQSNIASQGDWELPVGTCNADTPCVNGACCSGVSLPPVPFSPGRLGFLWLTYAVPNAGNWSLRILAGGVRCDLHVQLRCQSRVRPVRRRGEAEVSPGRLLLQAWVSPAVPHSKAGAGYGPSPEYSWAM